MKTIVDKIDDIASQIGTAAEDHFTYLFNMVKGDCESPVEELMLAALMLWGAMPVADPQFGAKPSYEKPS